MLVVGEVVAVRAVPHWRRSRHRSHGGRRHEHDEEDYQQEPADADRAVLPTPEEGG